MLVLDAKMLVKGAVLSLGRKITRTSQGCCPSPCSHKEHSCRPIKNHRDLSIILSLSLVRRFVGKLNHPGPKAELKELDPPKGLGEQIRKLVFGVDVACLDASFLQTASDEVIPHPDVLTPFIENGVHCQGQSGLAVHPELHRSSVSAEEITKQSSKPSA